MGHTKRKQDSDNEDVEHSASDFDVSDNRKATKSKQSTDTKGNQSSSSKAKTAKKPKIDQSDDEPTREEQTTTRVPTNAQGEKYVDLGKMKRATVHPYKGQLYVDIREFYAAAGSGEEKPGKKGISLTLEQWQVLKSNLDTIDSLYAEQKGKK